MGFAELKKNSKKSIQQLVSAAEATTKKGSYGDDAEWKPTVDKAGNGYAVLRFLPAAEGEDLPWVRYWDHGFKGSTGRWYFEKSLTTIGQNDPVSELNSQLWNSGRDEDKELARDRKRKLHYVANILVVADTAAPENEGKVFKYKFGAKIFEKLNEAMTPEFDDETPVNPYDFWEGADFKLKIRQVAGFRNYDKSEFDKVSALFGGDDKKLEELYKKLHSLSEYTDPASYKSYAELRKKLYEVIGEVEVAGNFDTDTAVEMNTTAEPKLDAPKASDPDEDVPMGDDESIGYFAELAKS